MSKHWNRYNKSDMERFCVPYEVAILAKRLGFDQPCFGFWANDGKILNMCENGWHTHKIISPGTAVAAPIYQQMIDWLREKHNWVVDVFQEFDEKKEQYTGFWEIDISRLGKYEKPHSIIIEEVYPDYYKASMIGIFRVLLELHEKLIPVLEFEETTWILNLIKRLKYPAKVNINI